MKLRTSFFNGWVLLKNLVRFAPVWVLYAIGEDLGLLMLNLDKPGIAADDLAHIMGPVSIFHAGYALIVAACLFGDLFDSRMCNGLHAMPMRREGWLITNLVSGFLFALIPAIVGGVVAVVALKEFYWIGLLWQGTSLLQFVFFFGIAVFSAMCAGKRLGMIAIYGILNFLSMLIFWVADTVFEPLLPGVMLSSDWFNLFCPLVSMAGHSYINFYYDSALGGFFKGFYFDNLHYLYICAGIGILFTVFGWLLYRKRRLETAGDFISFRPMRVFFLLAYTVAVGVLLYSFGDVLGLYRDYGFLVVGLLIGWFTGWMLLERTVKIFNKKVLLGLVAFAAVFAGSIGLTIMDPMGIVTYVPEADEINNACMYLQKDIFYYEHEQYGLQEDRFLTEAEDIAQVRRLHQLMLQTPKETDGEVITVYVRYEKKNGMTVQRKYEIPSQSDTAEELKPFFSDPRMVFRVDDWGALKGSVRWIISYPIKSEKSIELRDPEQMAAVLDAVEADCKAGNFAQHDYFHVNRNYTGSMEIGWEHALGNSAEYVVVYDDCINTYAFLETLLENP